MSGGRLQGERLAETLADAAVELAAQPDLQATLSTTCSVAVSAMNADAAGIILRRSGILELAAATPDAAQPEEMQLALGDGPCLSSAIDAEAFLVPEMSHELRWPEWTGRMVDLGWNSCVSVWLLDRSRRSIGSLNIFGRRANQFAQQDVEVAQLFARHASVAIEASRTGETLHQAIDARHAIGIAQGILMHRYGVDLNASFATLRRYSQNHNIKLALVARRVIEDQDLPGAVDRSSGNDQLATG